MSYCTYCLQPLLKEWKTNTYGSFFAEKKCDCRKIRIKDMTMFSGKWDSTKQVTDPVWWPEDKVKEEKAAQMQKVFTGISVPKDTTESTKPVNQINAIYPPMTIEDIKTLREDLKAYGELIDGFKKMEDIFKEHKKKAAVAVGMDMEPESLSEWVDAAYGNAKAKGWHDTNSDDFVTKLALIHSEVSEALEDYRNNKPVTEIWYEGDKPCGVPTELADVLIRVFDLCGKFGIDIQKAVEIKHAFNKTRPHRHGGKKI